LDVENMGQDEEGNWGPWFGPMIGLSATCYVVQQGTGDDGRLLMGSPTGYVYQANEPAVLADDGGAIDVRVQTAHHFYHESQALNVEVMQVELEVLPTTSTIVGSIWDTIGPAGASVTLSAAVPAVYWGQFYWGEQYFTGSGTPVRSVARFDSSNARGRQLSTALEFSSSIERFHVFAIRHEARLLGATFGNPEE
jgi:hypothetical protein